MVNHERCGASILLIAGDVSGDVQTAALARTLLATDPTRTLHALGGKRLREIIKQSPEGQFIGDTTNCSAIGILSASRIYFRCRGLGDRLMEFLRTHPVDLAVLCDWGAFNARALSRLNAMGVPTLYYFPPCSWQRTGSRGLGIVRHVTRIATPFRWSAERLSAAGARAEWVGHPCLENGWTAQDRNNLRRKFNVSPNEKLVALLPGSRMSEIRVLGPRMAKAASLLSSQRLLRFVAVVPKELVREAYSHFPASIQVVNDCAKQLLLAADAAVIKTGTGTLEAVVTGTPQVAVYDVSKPSRVEWCLLWAWKRIRFIAMPNIILQREGVPELIGLQCQPHKIAKELISILEDDTRRETMFRDYAFIRQELGADLALPATERTAQIVEEMLNEKGARAIEPERVPV
jgi:lipid-A-disaccharide synthase